MMYLLICNLLEFEKKTTQKTNSYRLLIFSLIYSNCTFYVYYRLVAFVFQQYLPQILEVYLQQYH